MKCILTEEELEYEDLENTIKFLEGALCMSLKAVKGYFDDYQKTRTGRVGSGWIFLKSKLLDYTGEGINPAELRHWWKEYLNKDKARRAQEEKDRKWQEVKERALKKLTKEEKEALGIFNK